MQDLLMEYVCSVVEVTSVRSLKSLRYSPQENLKKYFEAQQERDREIEKTLKPYSYRSGWWGSHAVLPDPSLVILQNFGGFCVSIIH